VSEAASQRVSEPCQWVSVAEAAGQVGVSERTIWRYVRDGIIESRQEKRGQQSTRLINRESLPEEPCQNVSEAVRGPVSEGVGGCPDMAEAVGASQGLNSPRHDLSPGSAIRGSTEIDPEILRRAELAEQRAAMLESERDHLRAQLQEDVQQLRAQLERRDEEINRRAIAEEQLRVMLMKLEATNAELAGALVQKALPPAPEPVRKARWWQLWK
jgi:DNA-binding transcriptional MerR regulator